MNDRLHYECEVCGAEPMAECEPGCSEHPSNLALTDEVLRARLDEVSATLRKLTRDVLATDDRKLASTLVREYGRLLLVLADQYAVARVGELIPEAD